MKYKKKRKKKTSKKNCLEIEERMWVQQVDSNKRGHNDNSWDEKDGM